MVDRQAAQRGILEAILGLHNDGTFTALLDDFYASVLPNYFALSLPVQESEFSQPGVEGSGSYTRFSRERQKRQKEFEDSLQQWACRYRLTSDLTENGEGLPWILKFGRRACENRSLSLLGTAPAKLLPKARRRRSRGRKGKRGLVRFKPRIE